MIELTFSVATRPQSQGSIKSFIIEGKLDPRRPCDARGKPNWERKPRVVSTSDNPELQYFRDLIGFEAKRALVSRGYDPPFADKHEPVELIIEFIFERPKTVDVAREMVVRPDIDKLERALLDGMAGVLYVNDAQVVAVSKRKMYGAKEGVRVRAAVIRDVTLTDLLLHDATAGTNTKPPAMPAGGLRASRSLPRASGQMPNRKNRLAPA